MTNYIFFFFIVALVGAGGDTLHHLWGPDSDMRRSIARLELGNLGFAVCITLPVFGYFIADIAALWFVFTKFNWWQIITLLIVPPFFWGAVKALVTPAYYLTATGWIAALLMMWGLS